MNMQVIKATLCIAIVFCNGAYAELTIKDTWAIMSPDIGIEGSASEKQIATHEAYATLEKMGEAAHAYWKQGHAASESVVELSKIFEPVTRAFLIAVINEILAHEELFNEVVQNSYHNVTGFLKIVLVSKNKKSWKLRLHVWEPKEKEFPHNHKWDFFSKIMSGYLVQNIYDVDTTAMAPSYRICEPVSLMPILPNNELPCPCRDNYILNTKSVEECPLNSTTLAIKERDVLGTNESYFMPNNLTHTIESGRDAITFVFTSEQLTDNSEVFVPTEHVETRVVKYAASVTHEELKAELARVKTILSRLPLCHKYLPELIDTKHGYYNKHDVLFKTPGWRTAFLALQPRGTVLQLTNSEKEAYKVSVHNGSLHIGDHCPAKNTDYLFTLLGGTLYACIKDFCHTNAQLLCHTSFTDYAAVDSAGILSFDASGVLSKIEAYSGHYTPSPANMIVVREHLHALGLDTRSVSIAEYTDRFQV